MSVTSPLKGSSSDKIYDTGTPPTKFFEKMGKFSMLVIALGVAAVDRGCGSTLGSALAGSLASAQHPIPSILATGTNETGTNGTDIGAIASSSSSSSSFFGCGNEGLACEESGEECVQCVTSLFETGEDDGSGDDDGSSDDEDLSCIDRQNEICEDDAIEDKCLENELYVAWVGECFGPKHRLQLVPRKASSPFS